jgi:hypothetical protein
LNLGGILVISAFGFPALWLSFAFSLAGLLRRSPLFLAIGGIFALGPTLYISGGLHFPVVIVPLLTFVSAFLVRIKKTRWAWVIMVPIELVTLFTAVQFTYHTILNFIVNK